MGRISPAGERLFAATVERHTAGQRGACRWAYSRGPGLAPERALYGHGAHPRSLYNRLELRPAVKRAAAIGAALGALVVSRMRY